MRAIDLFDEGARLGLERTCFRFEGRSYAYGEVRDLSLRIGTGLRSLGFGTGSKGAVYSVNHPDAFTCVLGLLRAGMTWLPINPRNSVTENAGILADFDCDVLFYHSAFEGDLAAIGTWAPGIRRVICIDRDGMAGVGLRSWARAFQAEETALDDDPEAVVSITATGGTTGRAKGVMLTNRNVVAFAEGHIASRGYRAAPTYLAAAPMTHVAGRICFPVLRLGGTIVILPTPQPQAVLHAIERERVTMMFLPPTAVYTLLAQSNIAEFDLSSLELLMYGGAPISVAQLRRALETFGPVMTQGYGQTEAPMLLATLSPQDHFVDGRIAPDSRLSSCGRPTSLVQVEIMDDAGNILERGATGEIVVRGDIVMKGYYKNPEATAEVSRFGWHHTGDIGRFDDEGFLHIVDRKRDMIVSGGFNVYSSEVEQAIASVSGVQDVAVVGVPDEKWGEAVKAIVELVPGTRLGEAEIIAAVRPQLGGVKAPKSIEFWPTLPRNAAGKVLKREIRDRYWVGRHRRV